MVVFGLGSVVSMVNPRDLGGGRENPVYAHWKGGDIRRTDLDALRFRHFQTIRFLQGLRSYAADKKGDNFQSLAIPIQPVAQGQDFQPDRVDEELFSRFLLAKKAEEEGLVVGDGMIEDYLALVAGNVPVSKAEMAAINKEVNQGQAGLEAIKRQLKIELAYQQMYSFTLAGIPMIPNPTDAIELYAKTSRRVECQVLPIAVDPESVKEEPTASEIRKIFEEGKIEYPDPQGIKPGFKIGKRVNVQYFVANRDTFLQNEINKLTDAEVQAEYERLVEAESAIVMEVIPDENMPTLDDPNNAADDDAPPTAEDESKKDDASTNDADKDSGGDAAPTTNDKDPAPANSDEKGDGGLSTTLTTVRSQYVSAPRQEPTEPSAEEIAKSVGETAGEQSPAETKPEESQEKQGEPGAADQDDKSASSAEQTPTPADVAPLPQVDPAASAAAAAAVEKVQGQEPVLPGLAVEKAEDIKPKMRPKPLIDCAQQVKESLKGEAATQAIDDALKRAEAELGAYRMMYTRWKYGNETSRGDEPAPVDCQKIADKFGVEFRESGLVDDLQLEETEIGKIRVFRQVMGPNGRPQAAFPPLAQIIFQGYHDTNEFDPKLENDMMAGATYLYWLSEKQDARIPELDEVKSEVVQFWKKQKAFDKALQEAEQIAASLNEKPGETLVGKYPEKGLQTGEFTWFNTASNQPAISVPIGVTQPGDEFMKAVFSLDQYQAAATFNYVRDTVYVVQMMTEKATVAETGQDYLENRFFKFKSIPNDVRKVSQWYGQEINIDWNEEFTKSMGLEFLGQ